MSAQLPILIVQMGRPPYDVSEALGEQPDWFLAALAPANLDVLVVRPHMGEPLPQPGSFAGAVVTGSWHMVTDLHDWSERTAEWIRQLVAADVPLLGVCYGHQLMAHALGGLVGYHPRGRELGLQTIRLRQESINDPLLAHIPGEFPALLTHAQTVLVKPPGAVVLGASEHDENQILRYGPNAFSIQFHPEFTPAIMSLCIQRRRTILEQEGADVEQLLLELAPTPDAHAILMKFATTAAQVSADSW
ncbi:glutamine amidotransferase [Variovorax sp. EBFNA2]|uniref:glutamine amidotransferase n=1 Tax=Variovorax sp. EBFNA2 TaxID=3342097 RepID=UPI0029C0EE99|nr:glutamine amidotransferase [Variovorax boronicumulans]WPG41542.1 glutamine amidotransferase [Variovorax boronicumulans]